MTNSSANPTLRSEPLVKTSDVNQLFALVKQQPSAAPVPGLKLNALSTNNNKSSFSVRQSFDKMEEEYRLRLQHLITPRGTTTAGPAGFKPNSTSSTSKSKGAVTTLQMAAAEALNRDALTARPRRSSFCPKAKSSRQPLFEAPQGYPLPQLPDVHYGGASPRMQVPKIRARSTPRRGKQHPGNVHLPPAAQTYGTQQHSNDQRDSQPNHHNHHQPSTE
eukprot:PhM_4_TR18081/c1_g2_i12/m.106366